jgi:hypothetical protein
VASSCAGRRSASAPAVAEFRRPRGGGGPASVVEHGGAAPADLPGTDRPTQLRLVARSVPIMAGLLE